MENEVKSGAIVYFDYKTQNLFFDGKSWVSLPLGHDKPFLITEIIDIFYSNTEKRTKLKVVYLSTLKIYTTRYVFENRILFRNHIND
jgi:hypothetical protein